MRTLRIETDSRPPLLLPDRKNQFIAVTVLLVALHAGGDLRVDPSDFFESISHEVGLERKLIAVTHMLQLTAPALTEYAAGGTHPLFRRRIQFCDFSVGNLFFNGENIDERLFPSEQFGYEESNPLAAGDPLAVRTEALADNRNRVVLFHDYLRIRLIRRSADRWQRNSRTS